MEYPNLSKMARDYLAIPGILIFLHSAYLRLDLLISNKPIIIATSVPIERVFSGGTDLINQRRCSLEPKTIRICMCLKSWLRQ
jgi:hypothetical protein